MKTSVAFLLFLAFVPWPSQANNTAGALDRAISCSSDESEAPPFQIKFFNHFNDLQSAFNFNGIAVNIGANLNTSGHNQTQALFQGNISMTGSPSTPAKVLWILIW